LIRCFFVSDLHGRVDRYEKLFAAIGRERPAAVFLGGDLLPSGFLLAGSAAPHEDFVSGFLAAGFVALRSALGAAYPRVFLILGNDDPRREEEDVLAAAADGLWEYAHGRRLELGGHPILGYACIPPTPFLLKDWERYDVSRHVDPGAVPPEEGWRSQPVDPDDLKYGTIQRDLEILAGDSDLTTALCLFHAPPYQTPLDRAALDGKLVDHVPLDVNIGSIAVRRFIESRQPLVTLHGHVHESARLTGAWMARLGRTICLSAAHDGPELALVDFDLTAPAAASRHLI
jgi:Icc-related predicted phosphoesterase